MDNAILTLCCMEDWWLDGTVKNSELKALESLSHAHFWSNSLDTPQCQLKFTEDTRRSDTSSQFRTSYQLDSGLAPDAYARPEAEAVFRFWEHFMLGCSTVTIESHKNCCICLPFANLCLEEVLEAEDSEAEDSIPMDFEQPTSPFWLARAMAEAAVEKFKWEGYEETWREDNFELHGPFQKESQGRIAWLWC